MLDYHIHPDFSPDAQGSIEQFCERAVVIGMQEVCFTTHYEPDPVRAGIERVIVQGNPVAVDSDWPERYLAEIERCRRRFPELTVVSGVEVGYELGLEGKIANFLSRYRFDFVLGAIHCLDHVAITSRKELDDFQTRLKPMGAGYLARRYFEYVRAAADSRLFDCLAHLDIWRKYISSGIGAEFESAIQPWVTPMLEAIVRSGVGLEINTSALRRGDSEPYPAAAIVWQAVKLGVRVFTIGSDAHRPEELGDSIDCAYQLLTSFGMKPARFRDRRPIYD